MTPADIKRNLNKPVIFREHRYGNEHKYILTGATIRLGQDGFYYLAEITDDKLRDTVSALLAEEGVKA